MVALIAEGENDSVPFVVAVNPAAQDLGLSANELVKNLGAAVNGAGAARPIWHRAPVRERQVSTRHWPPYARR